VAAEEVAGYTPVLDREERRVGATSAPTSVLDRCTDRRHDNKPQLAPSLLWLETPFPTTSPSTSLEKRLIKERGLHVGEILGLHWRGLRILELMIERFIEDVR